MTAGGDAFARIVAALNEAPFRDDGWLRASALIDEACRTYGSMLGHTTGDTVENSQVHLAILSHRGERQEEIERLYLDNYVRIDERIPHLRNLPDGCLAHISDLLSEEQLKASVVYNEYLVRVHRSDGLDVRLDGPGGSNILWSIREPIDGDRWSSDQLGLIEALLPHIRQYITVQDAIANAGGENASFADMLELPGAGIVKIDARGRIVAANDRARAELQRRNALSDLGGTLSAILPGDNDRLQRLLAKAMPPLGGPAARRFNDRESNIAGARAHNPCATGGEPGDGLRRPQSCGIGDNRRPVGPEKRRAVFRDVDTWPHARGGGDRDNAGRGLDRPPDCRENGSRIQHSADAPEAHLRQARGLAAIRAGEAGVGALDPACAG